MKFTIIQHLPFILSICVLIITLSILYIRKWILNKINALNLHINESINASHTIMQYAVSKQKEQYEIMEDAILKSNTNIKHIGKAELTQSEEILLSELAKYNNERVDFIKKMLNKH